MQLYIITERTCEYDDNYNLEEGGSPVAAFKKKENAETECARRNIAKAKSGEFEIADHGRGTPDYFVVSKVEVADHDAISYSDSLKAAKEAIAAAASPAKQALTDLTAKLFAENPTLVAFRWNQCTPYFNDGDTCVFSVNEPLVKFDGAARAESDEDGFVEYYSLSDPQKSIANEARKITEAIAAPDMERVFGDHIQVTATRDGFEVEGYDHE